MTKAEVERLLDLVNEDAPPEDLPLVRRVLLAEQNGLTMKLIGEVLAASVLEMPVLLEDKA